SPAGPADAPGRAGRIVALAAASLMAALVSLALKLALADSNLTQRAFPFMVAVASVGLVASLWLWFLRTPRTNQALAAFVLGNMATAALIVLPFALATTGFRRGNDPQPPPPLPGPAVPTVEPVAPARLAGVGYLPED